MSERVACIIQARVDSARLPGKVLAKINGQPMLAHVILRCCAIGVPVIVATTTGPEDDDVERIAVNLQVDVYRCPGPAADVLGRYAAAAERFKLDVILRVTADCPLFDPQVAGRVLALYRTIAALDQPVDYVSNVHPVRTYPDGLDVEVFSRDLLNAAHKHATSPTDREHVTPWMHRNCLAVNVTHEINLSAHRWTVDVEEDLTYVRALYAHLPVSAYAHLPVAAYSLADTLRAHLGVTP